MELWADPVFREAYEQCSDRYTLSTGNAATLPYFARHVARLAAPHYVPSLEDILRIRIITTGITCTTLDTCHASFQVWDAVGTRRERKKWIHLFERVDSLVFTVDVSAYCRTLMEDESTNSMTEQFNLWNSIANSRWFLKTNFLLVFTKIDELAIVLGIFPVSTYLPDFQEPDTSLDMSQRVVSPGTQQNFYFLFRLRLNFLQKDFINEIFCKK